MRGRLEQVLHYNVVVFLGGSEMKHADRHVEALRLNAKEDGGAYLAREHLKGTAMWID